MLSSVISHRFAFRRLSSQTDYSIIVWAESLLQAVGWKMINAIDWFLHYITRTTVVWLYSHSLFHIVILLYIIKPFPFKWNRCMMWFLFFSPRRITVRFPPHFKTINAAAERTVDDSRNLTGCSDVQKVLQLQMEETNIISSLWEAYLAVIYPLTI